MKYTSIYPFILTKIERNNLLIKIFELENKIAKLEMVIKLRILNHNQFCIDSIKQINALEKEQCTEYTREREFKIKNITDETNKRKVDIEDLKREILAINDTINGLVDQINNINKNLPIIKIIINHDTEAGLLEHQKKCSY